MISLGSQRYGGVAHMTRVLQHMDIGSLGKRDRVGEEVQFRWESSGNAWRWLIRQMRVYGSGLEDRPTWTIL